MAGSWVWTGLWNPELLDCSDTSCTGMTEYSRGAGVTLGNYVGIFDSFDMVGTTQCLVSTDREEDQSLNFFVRIFLYWSLSREIFRTFSSFFTSEVYWNTGLLVQYILLSSSLLHSLQKIIAESFYRSGSPPVTKLEPKFAHRISGSPARPGVQKVDNE